MPEALEGMRVSANFFSTLGVTPLLGRTFLTDEDQPGQNRVVVLGEEVWLRRFGGDTNILGHTITLEDQPVTVVGGDKTAFTGRVSRTIAALARSLAEQGDPTSASSAVIEVD